MKVIILIFLMEYLLIVSIKEASCDLVGIFNAALTKPTIQSSTYEGYNSSLAVDGNNDSYLYRGPCTHTLDADITYWQVDLQQLFNVSSVNVTNRGDCCGNRLRNITIVGSNITYGNSSWNDWKWCKYYGSVVGNGATMHFSCDHLLYTRYIIIIKVTTQNPRDVATALSLCEVQVIAECANGKYGNKCKSNCSENCTSPQSCNKTTGYCQSCKPGYKANRCDTPCSPGNYGENCSQPCYINCDNSSSTICDHISGKCDGCMPGYKGEYCTQECEQGTYGINCSSRCPENCLSSECDHKSGKCGLCNPGFHGDSCNQTCSNGTYGINCMDNCSPYCNDLICEKTDGSCTCKEGYTGNTCVDRIKENNIKENSKQDNGSPIAAAVGGAIGSLVVITIVVILVIFILRRRRHKQPQHEVPDGKRDQNMGYNNESFDISEKGAAKPVVQVKPSMRYLDSNTQMEKQIDRNVHLYENAVSLEKIIIEEKNEPKPKEKPVISVKPNIRSASNTTEEQDNELEGNANLYENADRSATLVDADNLESYVAKKKENPETLKNEYEGITKAVHACDIAENPMLREKNRYKNIYPYDNNSVNLQKIDDDALSTYINASYIKDYRKNISYIAALGATNITISDFWRMIWEQNVKLIVMVTNLVENMKIKCEQYWPTEGLVNYSGITILLENTIAYPSYVVRTLKATKDETSRTIMQYQYTAWPDKSTPQHLPSLCKIRDVMKTYRNDKKVPILVHCSAGVGRTGTLIALDILMDQLDNEKQVDINKCVATLRNQRANLVQTQIQYTYLHEALCEIIAVGSTVISSSKVASIITSEQGKKKQKEQFSFLERTKQNVKDNDMELGKFENKEKNRDMNVIPSDNNRLKLISTPEKYINAVYVPGYNKHLAFIASQVPLENTVADFWKMIFEVKSTSIVFLENDDTLQDWFALDKSSKIVEDLIVTTTAIEPDGLCTKYTVSLGKTDDTAVYANMSDINIDQKDMLQLEIFNIKAWAKLIRDKEMKSILACLQQTSKDKSNLCTVVCRNGAHHTGVYIACRWLVDMATAENEVDIYHVVKTIQIARPQFVRSLEQYMLLYQFVAENYESVA